MIDKIVLFGSLALVYGFCLCAGVALIMQAVDKRRSK